jgi:hypothetical protein
VANLKTIQPFVQRWQVAIHRRDVARAIQAGEDYEAAWQAALRSALAAYTTLVHSTPAPTVAQAQAANKTALEAVALAQQTFVGQFWTDPGLQAFLAGLPT